MAFNPDYAFNIPKTSFIIGAAVTTPDYLFVGESDGQVHKIDYASETILDTFQASAGWGGSAADIVDILVTVNNNLVVLSDNIYLLDSDLNILTGWPITGTQSAPWQYIAVNSDEDVASVKDDTIVTIWDNAGNQLGSFGHQSSFSGDPPTERDLAMIGDTTVLAYRSTPPQQDPAMDRWQRREFDSTFTSGNTYSSADQNRAIAVTSTRIYVADDTKILEFDAADGTLLTTGSSIYSETGRKFLTINDDGTKLLLATLGAVHKIDVSTLTIDLSLTAANYTTVKAVFDKLGNIFVSDGKVYDSAGTQIKDFSSLISSPQCIDVYYI